MLPVLWMLVGILFVAALWPVRVIVCGSLQNEPVLDGYLHIRFFGGLLQLRYRFAIQLLQPSRFFLFYKEEDEPRVVWRWGNWRMERRIVLPIEHIWKRVSLVKLHIAGKVGFADDACATAMAAGAVSALLHGVVLAFTSEKNQSNVQIDFIPAFYESCIRMNLEGIAKALPVHIISVILFYGSKNRKGKKAAWRILSKTS